MRQGVGGKVAGEGVEHVHGAKIVWRVSWRCVVVGEKGSKGLGAGGGRRKVFSKMLRVWTRVSVDVGENEDERTVVETRQVVEKGVRVWPRCWLRES